MTKIQRALLVGVGMFTSGSLGFHIPTSTVRRLAPLHAAPPSSTIVIGSGPTGLFTSIMLARRGYTNVRLYDRLPRPPPPDANDYWGDPYRSYNLGLGGRGQIALKQMEAWETLVEWCAPAVGRKDWTPEQGEQPERIYIEREYKTQVIQRDRLASCLLKEIESKYADNVRVTHDVECIGVEWVEKKGVRVSLSNGGRTWVEDAEWVVGADGVKSTVRDAMEAASKGRIRGVKFEDRNEFVYKTLPLDFRPFYHKGYWRPDLNYSARTEGDVTIEALPTKEGLYVGVVLFRPDNPEILALKDLASARAFFDERYPQFKEVIRDEDLQGFVERPISRLPAFSYCAGDIQYKGSAVLLGDAIHAVKPYFGLGANSALQDVTVLDECLQEAYDDVRKALPLFSKKRAKEAKALVELQRSFDGNARTPQGFLTFILPLIVDGICHKLAPKVFAPNGIRLLQDYRLRFTQVRWIKRKDRALQALLAAGAFVGTSKAGSFAFKAVKAAVTKTPLG